MFYPKNYNPKSTKHRNIAKDIVMQNRKLTYPLLGVRGVDFANGAIQTYQQASSDISKRNEEIAKYNINNR